MMLAPCAFVEICISWRLGKVVATALKKKFRGLRRFNAARDMGQVAKLLEETFVEELGPESRRALREFRLMGYLAPFLWLTSWASPDFPALLSGYVWVEDGRIVGNVTVNRMGWDGRHWLVSNLAVHPDYRRRGIARELMLAAIDLAGRQGGEIVTLEVRRANTAAQNLYRDLGFTLLEGATELRLERIGEVAFSTVEGFRLRRRRYSDWRRVYELAKAATPPEVQQVTPLKEGDFRISLDRKLSIWITNLVRRQDCYRWAVEKDEKFIATLDVHAVRRQAPHRLEMTVHPQYRGRLEETLVTKALSILRPYPPRSVQATIPASHREAIALLQDYGFVEVRTLDRLGLELADPHCSS